MSRGEKKQGGEGVGSQTSAEPNGATRSPAAKTKPRPRRAGRRAHEVPSSSAGRGAIDRSAATGRRRSGPSDPAPRRPRRADLLAVAVVICMSVLAACSSQLDQGRSKPAGTAGPSGEVTVQFLDVGQGDSVLVRSPEGKTMLIDGGRSTERMGELLEQHGVQKVDLMVASHADADHIAGLVEAARTTQPTLFINNGIAGTTRTWERLVAVLGDAGTQFQKASNQVINLGSVKVRVIAPPAGMGDDQNENSVGIRVEFGEFAALMTGDSETKETQGWLAENRAEVRGPVQVYKSIHHGAANGDNAAWLAAVKPENVVISVGENSYGHPTPQALDLYDSRGIRIYRTDRQGTVTFRAKGDGTYVATTER
ncbi:Metal-dependent hydrolase, beta-lactamase superfamily II [Deinococcus reticulitermitis]|uniref:Metal-dependent hydrolase, beta-lactamase superfamily II n=1 Tax=Deinococcus reticulitermitis TaxID=856736 RepID=A0A1H6TX11_9DEIO|nr:ComEC/Rec2 family competence protein [Deinococcus reticulitermitis]SEI83736.1 Metal-dependent hydrolase, beta-lactamase superfamily II [Deinococcus reticulitermitis]